MTSKYHITVKNYYHLYFCENAEIVMNTIISIIASMANYNIIVNNKKTTILVQDGHRKICDKNNLLTDDVRYIALEISANTPMLSEAGMLAEVTKFFSDNKIAILCISNYENNLIYIACHDYNRLRLLLATDTNNIFSMDV